MTPLALFLSVLASLLVAAAATYALRRATTEGFAGDPDALSLTFDTSTAKAKQGWAAFWARDPFVEAQRARDGVAFGTYAVPGENDAIATHLSRADVQQHTLVLGATGSGKSNLLETLALANLRAKRGFTLVDLHGDLFTRVAAWALTTRPQRLVLLDFTRPDSLPGWNPLNPFAGIDPGRQVDLLVGVMKRLYAGEEAASWAWGVKVEELMRHALRACIESASAFSLADLPSFFLLPSIRQRVLASLPEEHIARVYFTTRFGAREEMYVSAVLNKLEPFLGSIAVQRFLGQKISTFDLMGAIDRGDTVLVNLAKGYLGPTADVMGRLLVNVLQTAALRRERIAPARRTPYALLLDEAHVLAGAESGLEDFLVAARKYRVSVTLAAQGLSLFPPNFRAHLLGNTARQFFFRLPHSEARMLAPDIFEPLGSVWRAQVRPNERIEDPLLTPAEEIAWRTRELASLPVGACYWYLKDRPYKARRIQILKPLDPPLRGRALERAIEAATAKQKGIAAPEAQAAELKSALLEQIRIRSERRNRVVGISEDIAQVER
ncbi:MAG: type IV secretory system conjugative DNA transfer family protein [Thermoanaerobaculia bacterium]